MKAFDFRLFQTLSDLRRVQQHFGPAAVYPITGGDGVLFAELCSHLNTPLLSGPNDLSPLLLDAIWRALLKHPLYDDTFVAATTIVLINNLQGGQSTERHLYQAELFFEHYRTLAAPIRAAIFNGFAKLQNLEFAEFGEPISTAETLTNSRKAMENELVSISHSMAPDQIDSFAISIDKDSPEFYRNALIDLLATTHVTFRDVDIDCFLDEEIRRMSYDSNEPSYVPCTAIVMLNALHSEDASFHMACKYESQWRDYKTLKRDTRSAFHIALRYFYESDQNWAPSFDTYHYFVGDRDVAIDWSPTPLQ